MGHIQRFLKTKNLHEIVDILKYFTCSKEVYIELGEPILVDSSQNWIFEYIDHELSGFICYTESKILYAYTVPKFRCKGVFSRLLNQLPDNKFVVIASEMSYPIFLKNGYKVLKNYKNCHKLEKTK